MRGTRERVVGGTGGGEIRRGLMALAGAVAAAGVLALPGTASAQCGPATPNQTCVYLHSSTSATGTGTSLSFGFTVVTTAECSDPMLAVLASTMNDAGSVADLASATWTVGSTTQNLVNLVRKASDPFGDASRKKVEIWALPSPTAGTGTVTVTVSGGATAQMVAGAVLACGVDQSSPIIASTGTYGNSSTPGTTLNSATGALLLDVIAVDGNIDPVTPGNGETLTWDGNTGTLSSNVRGASAYKYSTATTENPSWTLGAATQWVIAAATLRPRALTVVGLESFEAEAYEGGTVLRWHTGYEAATVGFRLHREAGTGRVPVSRDLIVGSGLGAGGVRLEAGYTYAWLDPDGRPGDRYWLEEVGAAGTVTWHGPFTARPGLGRAPRVVRSRLLSEAFRAQGTGPRGGAPGVHGAVPALRAWEASAVPVRRPRRGSGRVAPAPQQVQWMLAGAGAARIEVSAPGWYRVTLQDLEAAGFELSDPGLLRLYADGVEQAIRLTGGGADGEGPEVPAVEFFGVPNDTPSSGTRTYWLVQGRRPGLRMERRPAGSAPAEVATVPFTVRVRERLVYVPGVLNGERENFFGRAITAEAAVVTLAVDHLDTSAGGGATLRLALQGLTGEPFAVQVSVNGKVLGEVEMEGAVWQEARLDVPPSWLIEGENTLTLARLDSSSIALVDTVELTYPRLTFTGGVQTALTFPEEMAGREVRLRGFVTGHVRVIDVSEPSRPVELEVAGGRDAGGYYADLVVPVHAGPTTLLVFSDEQVARPARVVLDAPSAWHARRHRADMVIVAPSALLPAVEPLRRFHEAEGLAVAAVDVQDVYDEFSFGAKDPGAIRRFLERAHTAWEQAPRYVLLVGDASYDPRDYLGFGDDLVPTRLIDTEAYETASDGWFADFDDDGVPEMAVGRLPVGSPEEAAAVVEKLVASADRGVRLESVLTVADLAAGNNFAQVNRGIAGLLPAGTRVLAVEEDVTGVVEARRSVLDALAHGVDFVLYAGHGTVDRWRGDVLTSDDAASLGNGHHPAVFTMMNCLNGVFQEPLLEGLGEVLIRQPQGGAVAVWASTAATSSGAQELLMRAFYGLLSTAPGTRIGDADLLARRSTTDLEVRRTWVLLGDPAMKVEGGQ